MNAYPFVEAEQAGQRNVTRACALLEVSRTAYYQWSRHVPSAHARKDEALGQQIERIHHDSSGTYGRPRILAQLRRDGVCIGSRRVARLMRQRGLDGRCGRRSQRTTIPDPQAGTVAANLLKRNFDAAALKLNAVWRHLLHPYLGGLAVPGHGDRPRQSPGGRLGDGRAHAHHAGQ